jgi:hypothetical protein
MRLSFKQLAKTAFWTWQIVSLAVAITHFELFVQAFNETLNAMGR